MTANRQIGATENIAPAGVSTNVELPSGSIGHYARFLITAAGANALAQIEYLSTSAVLIYSYQVDALLRPIFFELPTAGEFGSPGFVRVRNVGLSTWDVRNVVQLVK